MYREAPTHPLTNSALHCITWPYSHAVNLSQHASANHMSPGRFKPSLHAKVLAIPAAAAAGAGDAMVVLDS